MIKRIHKVLRFLFITIILLTVLIVQQSLFGLAETQNDIDVEACDRPVSVPGEYLVRFKDLPEGQFNTLSIGASSILEEEKVLYGSDISLMKIKNDVVMTLSDTDFLEQLKSDPSIEHVEPNYYLYPMSEIPNDQHFNALWGLNNKINPGIDISIFDAWDIALGSYELVVAVIDSGVNYLHDDLENKVDLRGKNFIDGYEPNDIYNPNVDKHGTHVSGTIAAVRNNSIGIAGVAPNVKILPLKFIVEGTGGNTADAIEAINYAKSLNIKISNNSWGVRTTNPGIELKKAIAESGMLFIAASGNEGINNDIDSEPVYPASYDLSNIISVAAIDKYGNLADFSCYGAATVDIGAPGVEILSTVGNDYRSGNGTSMAAPHVTGVAALMYSIEPNLSPEEAIDIIMETGKPLDSLEGKTKSGKMVDANAALLEVINRSTSLSDIGISIGRIYPEFNSDITDYSILVDKSTNSINITPTLNYAGSVLDINNEPHNSGEPIEILLNDIISTIEIGVSSEYHPEVKTYTIDILKGLDIINNDFIVYPMSFTDEDNEPINVMSDNDIIRIKTYIRNNTEETKTPIMLISIFDEYNKLIKVENKIVPIEKQKKEEATIDFELPQDVSNYSVKTFIWNALDGIKPLSKTSVFP